MKIISDPNEMMQFYAETRKARNAGGFYKTSEILEGYVYWNAGGSERCFYFPTIYFPEKIFNLVINKRISEAT